MHGEYSFLLLFLILHVYSPVVVVLKSRKEMLYVIIIFFVNFISIYTCIQPDSIAGSV